MSALEDFGKSLADSFGPIARRHPILFGVGSLVSAIAGALAIIWFIEWIDATKVYIYLTVLGWVVLSALILSVLLLPVRLWDARHPEQGDPSISGGRGKDGTWHVGK
jgi:hypothetical protein